MRTSRPEGTETVDVTRFSAITGSSGDRCEPRRPSAPWGARNAPARAPRVVAISDRRCISRSRVRPRPATSWSAWPRPPVPRSSGTPRAA